MLQLERFFKVPRKFRLKSHFLKIEELFSFSEVLDFSSYMAFRAPTFSFKFEISVSNNVNGYIVTLGNYIVPKKIIKKSSLSDK